MVYRGQLIQSFDTSPLRQNLFENRQFFARLARFIQLAVTVLSIFYLITNPIHVVDVIIIVSFQLLLISLLEYNRRRRFSIQEHLNESLDILEYGIQFPPSITGSGETYLEYNQISEINVGVDGIEVVTQVRYNLPLDMTEQSVLMLKIFEKIRENLLKVENRNYPTIIPKAYFRDIT